MLGRRSWPLRRVIGSLGFMTAGALAPWETLTDRSSSGVDLQGWKMFEAGAVGAVGLAFYKRRAAILMAIGGLLGAAVCAYEARRISDFKSVGIIEVAVGRGLWLSLVASLSLILAGIASAFARSPRSERHELSNWRRAANPGAGSVRSIPGAPMH
jgi:hypothetical protein